jgi:hypothetical protein
VNPIIILLIFLISVNIHKQKTTMSQLKDEIKQAHDLGDEYNVQVEKYLPIKEFMGSMDISNWKAKKRPDCDVYDVHFYKNNKYKLSRKGVIKSNVMQVSREANNRQMSLYNIYLVFTLFRR